MENEIEKTKEQLLQEKIGKRRGEKWEAMVDECTITLSVLRNGMTNQFRIDITKIGLLAVICLILLFKL